MSLLLAHISSDHTYAYMITQHTFIHADMNIYSSPTNESYPMSVLFVIVTPIFV